ncbi:hypothetical protein [Ulvibacterium sp.]|uniref:hypothetical protein n=1 Tax=Ulvibacterium sp. TaxID=2665914 RepID=UPI003BAB4843
MKNSILLSTLFLLLVFTVGCQHVNYTKIDEESLAIVNLLYNSESLNFPVPPPPPKNEKGNRPKLDKKVTDKLIDKRVYAIVTTGESKGIILKSLDIPAEYKNILEESNITYFIKDLHNTKVLAKTGDSIPVVYYQKGLKIHDLTKKNNVIGVLYFSDIKFNGDFSKAILKFGSYTHGLAGSTSIVGLEKKDGMWVVRFSKNISES